jgi:Sigma-70 region 2
MNAIDPFEAIVCEHCEALFRFAMSLTREESEARDLTQQTFYTWATKGHQLRDISKVKTWLFTTLHRTTPVVHLSIGTDFPPLPIRTNRSCRPKTHILVSVVALSWRPQRRTAVTMNGTKVLLASGNRSAPFESHNVRCRVWQRR